MGGGLLAPALPSLVEPFSVSETSVGLVLGVYTFAAAASLPFTGLLIDSLGRRPVAIGCLTVDGLFGLLCLAAPTFEILLVLRFMQGIGIAGLIPVAMTVISDWYSGDNRLHMMGLLSSTISFSAVIIPLIGGLLAGMSWRHPFGVYGLSLLLALLYYIWIPETAGLGRTATLLCQAERHVANLKLALKMRPVQVIFAHCLVMYFSLYAVVTFLPIVLSSIHKLHGPAAGIALSLQGVIATLMASQAVKVKRILPYTGRLLLGFALISAALTAISLHGSIGGLALSIVLFGTGMGVLQPTVYNQTTTVADEELTGSIVSLFNTVKFIGMTLAPVLLGFAHRCWSIKGVFAVSGIASLLWLLLHLVSQNCRRQP